MSVTAKPAYQDDNGEWVYPQRYFVDGKHVAKSTILKRVNNDPLVQEAIKLDARIGALIERAKQQRCIYGYEANNTFYHSYKPHIVSLVGWESKTKGLKTMQHYEAVYEAVYQLLPGDEYDLYEDGIMSNGMFSPRGQEKYGREYP